MEPSEVIKNHRVAIDNLTKGQTPDGRPVAINFGDYRTLVEAAERGAGKPAKPAA